MDVDDLRNKENENKKIATIPLHSALKIGATI